MKTRIIFLSLSLWFSSAFTENLKIVEINHQGTEICVEVFNPDDSLVTFSLKTYNPDGSECTMCSSALPNYTVNGHDTLSISVGGILPSQNFYGFLLHVGENLACDNTTDCWVSINGEIVNGNAYTEFPSLNAGNETISTNESIQYLNNNGTFEWVENVAESCGSDNVVLPVEFVQFVAKNLDNEQVLLLWETATELSNDGFWVQKYNPQNRSYIDIAFVDSKAPGGNSQQTLNYTYTDVFPAHGPNLYRLKQVDFDGKYAYSKVVSVSIDNPDIYGYGVYPNPTAGIVEIKSALDFDRAEVYNMTGQRLITSNQGNIRSFDLSAYPAGMYVVRLQKDLQSKTFTVKKN